MRIAIPIADGKLAMHFGHCERFALVDVDPSKKRYSSARTSRPLRMSPACCPSGWRNAGPTRLSAEIWGSELAGCSRSEVFRSSWAHPLTRPSA